MPLTKPTFPDIDPAEFLERPFFERMRTLATFWAEHGFGTPRMVHLIYVAKVALLYVLGGLLVVSATSDVGPVWAFGSWWREPVVYQKLILWTVLLEVLGIAGSWGPLAGHFKPKTGGATYWLRPGTIRLPPWPGKVPLTRGDTRTVVDVLLYAGFAASLVVALVAGVSAATLVPAIALLIVTGLRDKVIFLAARGEQYLPAMVFMAVLGPVDLIIALKLLIVVVWIGAGVSKFGKHFVNVVPPMVSNAPFNPFRSVRRAHYRNFPDDLRPSHLAGLMAHAGGTAVELVLPLVLLFSPNPTVTLLAAIGMVVFHAFIFSTFPIAVPLEWNVLFAFGAVFLFVGHPVADGYGVLDFSQPWMLPVILGGLLVFPILGNLRPDLVSFLPSMRQYAGNWATATWAFAPGCEARLNELAKPAKNQVDQLVDLEYDPAVSEVLMQITMGWRTLHSQARGLLSVLQHHLDDIDRYTIREAEFACNSVIGWNFGDGHLHDERLIAAIQRRLHFAPGEFVVAFVESQPIHKETQAYRVIDAALGVVERGTWKVADAVAEQPWLPNGPIPLTVEWTLPGYTPAALAPEPALALAA